MAKFITAVIVILAITSCNNTIKDNPQKGNPKIALVSELPSEVDESSALLYYKGFMYTINDSGNKPILYEMDTVDYEIARKIYFNNAFNIDWEALAINDTHLFIGDFGNNYGTRNDLCVYYFKLSELTNDTITPGKISFTYSDWQQPQKKVLGTDFDCETMIALNDTLWLFTKQWNSFNTTIYKLPIEEGDHVLEPWITLPIDGLATDACFGIDKNEIWLTGYKSYIALLWRIKVDKNHSNVELENRWIIDSPSIIQNEGIFFLNNELWITTESFDVTKASLYKIVFQ